MRLNRVLLLAASINMAMLATVFTISCSGDDGKQGPPGSVECTMAEGEKNGTFGTFVTCGGATSFIPNGVNGEDGPGGNDPTQVGACNVMAAPFNAFELKIKCPTMDTVYTCASEEFDNETYLCSNGSLRKMDSNRDEYNNGDRWTTKAEKCTPSTPGSCANEKKGVILKRASFKCGPDLGTYDPNEYFCDYDSERSTPYKLTPLCGRNDYDIEDEFCWRSGKPGMATKPRCGSAVDGSYEGKTYGDDQFCKYPAPATIKTGYNTGTDWTNYDIINTTVWKSSTAEVADLCEGKEYGNENGVSSVNDGLVLIKNTTFCTNGKITKSCSNSGSGSEFVTATHFCQSYTTPMPYCGTGLNKKTYTFDGRGAAAQGDTRCTGATVETQCGTGNILATDKDYSPATWYDASTHFCRPKAGRTGNAAGKGEREMEAAPKCFELELDAQGKKQLASGKPNTLGAGDNYEWKNLVTENDKPDGESYDGEMYFCDAAAGKVSRKCASTFYDSDSLFCWSETPLKLGRYCKGRTNKYDPDKRFCTWITSDEIDYYSTAAPQIDRAFCETNEGSKKYNDGDGPKFLGEYCWTNNADFGTAATALSTTGASSKPSTLLDKLADLGGGVSTAEFRVLPCGTNVGIPKSGGFSCAAPAATCASGSDKFWASTAGATDPGEASGKCISDCNEEDEFTPPGATSGQCLAACPANSSGDASTGICTQCDAGQASTGGTASCEACENDGSDTCGTCTATGLNYWGGSACVNADGCPGTQSNNGTFASGCS